MPGRNLLFLVYAKLADVLRSRLETRIREELGLAYGPGVEAYSSDALGDFGYIDVTIITDPAGVEISEVLRTRMYARDYEDLSLAREEYARLEANGAPCVGCAAPCAGSCPAGIEIGRLTRETHRELS